MRDFPVPLRHLVGYRDFAASETDEVAQGNRLRQVRFQLFDRVGQIEPGDRDDSRAAGISHVGEHFALLVSSRAPERR
jgi:hypothetical protein